MNLHRFLSLICISLSYLLSCRAQPGTDISRLPANPRPNIYSEISGQGDTTLLFIHGWNLNSTYWQQAARVFTDRYRVVLIDLPYHGKSKKAGQGMEAEFLVQSIVDVIERKKLSNVILVGHSMGGDLALMTYFELPRRVIGIIGVDTLLKRSIFPLQSRQGRNFVSMFSSFSSSMSKTQRPLPANT